MDRDYRTGLLSTSILQYQALSGGNEKERNPVSALSVNRPRNHGLPDGLLGKADRPNAGICLCPGRAVGGSFQVLVGWSESEEFFFLGLIKIRSSSVAMVVHGKDSSPTRPHSCGAPPSTQPARTHGRQQSARWPHEVCVPYPRNFCGRRLHWKARRGGAKQPLVRLLRSRDGGFQALRVRDIATMPGRRRWGWWKL